MRLTNIGGKDPDRKTPGEGETGGKVVKGSNPEQKMDADPKKSLISGREEKQELKSIFREEYESTVE